MRHKRNLVSAIVFSVVIAFLPFGSVDSRPVRIVQTGTAANARFEPWKEYTSKFDGFSVSFPGTPKITSAPASSNIRSLAVGATLYEVHTWAYFVVRVANFRGPLPDLKSMNVLFDVARDSAVDAANGKLISEKEDRFQTFLGRVVVIELPDGRIFKLRMMVVGKRFYEVGVAIPMESSNEKGAVSFDARASIFLDSFNPGFKTDTSWMH